MAELADASGPQDSAGIGRTDSGRGLIRWPMHSFLLAAYPVLYTLARNVGEVAPAQSVRSFIAALAVAAACFGAGAAVTRNRHAAGVIATILVALTFGYGTYGASTVLLIVVLAGGLAAMAAAIVYRTRMARATVALNVFAALLLTIAGIEYARGWSPDADDGRFPDPEVLGAWRDSPAPYPAAPNNPPDIYFILLDAYARQDILSERYDYDNGYFVEFLRGRGFFVADEARSNYSRTLFSLSSTLNYSHLSEFVRRNGLETSSNSLLFHRLVVNNRVVSYLGQSGYTIHSIRGPYAIEGMVIDADSTHATGQWLNEFEYILIGRTPFRGLINRLARLNGYRRHYAAMQAVLDDLERSVDWPSPKFVMAHVFAPHPPFVFGRDGEFVQPRDPVFSMSDGDDIIGPNLSPEEYKRGFADQTHWLNHRLMTVIGEIRSRNPEAIIVIQGDHGPRSFDVVDGVLTADLAERFAILNALYLPGTDTRGLPPGLTTIETFPLILNVYFGWRLPALEATSYYSQPPYLFLFLPVKFGASGAVLDPTPEQRRILGLEPD